MSSLTSPFIPIERRATRVVSNPSPHGIEDSARRAAEFSLSLRTKLADTESATADASAAAESASTAQQSATSAAESAAVYDNVVADVTRLKQDKEDKSVTRLIRDILKKAVFTEDVEELIAQLDASLAEAGVIQSGSVLSIKFGVNVAQNGNTLTIT